MRSTSIVFIVSAVLVSASPFNKRASFTEANGQAAQALTAKFATLTESSPCTEGENACLNDGRFAQCSNGAWYYYTCKCRPLIEFPVQDNLLLRLVGAD
jgi:hypothetical protein